MSLCAGEAESFAGLSNSISRRDPQRTRLPDGIGIEAAPIPGSSGPRPSIAEMKSDGIPGVTGLNPYWNMKGSFVAPEFDYISVGATDLLRLLRTDQSGVVPCQFGEWLRQFLQPSVVGITAIKYARIRPEYELQRKIRRRVVRSIRQQEILSGLDESEWRRRVRDNAV